MKIRINHVFIALSSLAFITSPAIAGDSFSMDGHIDNKVSNEVIPVGENFVVIKSNNTGTISSKDTQNPMHGATGGCSGTFMVAMGKLTGNGYCTYTDTEGDAAIVAFSALALGEKGGTAGSWEMVGGTGKYATASGKGDYSSVPNADNTESVNTTTGMLKLK